MEKNELRTEMLARRKALEAADVETANAAIRQNLATIPTFLNAACILSYVDSKDNEVKTRPIINQLLDDGKTVLLPRCAPDNALEWCDVTTLEDLTPNRDGILEPKPDYLAQSVPEDAVCLVPGVVFHSNGHRIGYRGGYFDRFLAQFKGTSIGLAYEFQLRDDWQPEPHDRPVQYVVTEECVRECW